MEAKLVIPIEPKPKARPRAAVVGGHARVYTPKDTKVFEAKVAAIAVQQIKTPLEGPVCLHLAFYLKRPQRLMGSKYPDRALPCASRPDLDNLEKSCVDGLSNIAFKDDAQIAEKYSKKLYHEKNANPRVEIWIHKLP